MDAIFSKLLDPTVILQHGPATALLIIGFIFYRKDVQKQREEDRAERERERLQNGKQQSELTDTFTTTLEKVLLKAEASERLCEERYKMVLEQTLTKKKVK